MVDKRCDYCDCQRLMCLNLTNIMIRVNDGSIEISRCMTQGTDSSNTYCSYSISESEYCVYLGLSSFGGSYVFVAIPCLYSYAV